MCRDYDSKTSNCDAKTSLTGDLRDRSQPPSRGCLKDHGLGRCRTRFPPLYRLQRSDSSMGSRRSWYRKHTRHTDLSSSSVGFFTSHVLSIKAKGFLLLLAALMPFFEERTSTGASPSITICTASRPRCHSHSEFSPAGLFRKVFTRRRLFTRS